jgi:uncharacterized membrane protein
MQGKPSGQGRGGVRSRRWAMWSLHDSITDLGLSLAVLIVLTVIAVYAIGKVRKRSRDEDPTGIELLSKFRDVHAQGGLSDAEFRTIKTRLADRLTDGLKDKEERG